MISEPEYWRIGAAVERVILKHDYLSAIDNVKKQTDSALAFAQLCVLSAVFATRFKATFQPPRESYDCSKICALIPEPPVIVTTPLK
jgi:hypothetical protein